MRTDLPGLTELTAGEARQTHGGSEPEPTPALLPSEPAGGRSWSV